MFVNFFYFFYFFNFFYYGCLLIPILKDGLPDELKLFISRKFGNEIWTLDVLLKYIADELLAKES